MKSQVIAPNAGQESVWEYPLSPRLEPTTKHIQITLNEVVIADTRRAVRYLEQGHPPSYYVPPEDVALAYIAKGNGGSLCEWKGQATYYTVTVGEMRAVRAAWAYHNPHPVFRPIKDYFAFYAGPMSACTVDGELVVPQPGCYYGGWITSDVVGPFNGDPTCRYW